MEDQRDEAGPHQPKTKEAQERPGQTGKNIPKRFFRVMLCINNPLKFRHALAYHFRNLNCSLETAALSIMVF